MKLLTKSQAIFLAISICAVLCITFFVENPTKVSSTDKSDARYVVVIDAGHGGIDPGGIGISTKVKEADLNLCIAYKLKNLLESAGIQVVMTRTDENGLYGVYTKNYKKEDMAKRKEIIEKSNPDCMISVHMNRYTNKQLRGAQAFYNDGNDLGAKLAQCIQDEFKSQLPESDKAPSTGDYYMVKCTDTAAIIAECGYLSNTEDEKLLNTAEYQEKVAYAIFCGVVKYLAVPSELASA